MPIPDDYNTVLSALAEKTQEGVLEWKEGSYDLSVTVDSSKFSLWAGTDEQTDEPFVAFALKNQAGKAIDSWYVDQSDQDYYDVLDLYRLAKRHANGVPSLLQNLAERISAMKSDDD
jgi:hypothetical protein